MRPLFEITGADAIRLAARDRLEIFRKAGNGLNERIPWREARGEDPASIFVTVQMDGWWDGSQRVSEMLRYNVHDYFNSSGMYLGPDDDGVEPTWING